MHDVGQTQVIERGALTVFAAAPAARPADPVAAWLADAVADLLATVRGRLAGDAPPQRIALVLEVPRGRDAEERALAAGMAAAVRGAQQSLARELAPATAVNAVLCDAAAEAEPTLALLGDADGGFVTGATVDLRAAA